MSITKVGPVKNHCLYVLQNIKENCLTERQSDLVFICRKDIKEVHAHSVLLRNVSSLVSQNSHLLKTQTKIYITLEDIDSSTVEDLLQFLYLGKVRLVYLIFLLTEILQAK